MGKNKSLRLVESVRGGGDSPLRSSLERMSLVAHDLQVVYEAP